LALPVVYFLLYVLYILVWLINDNVGSDIIILYVKFLLQIYYEIDFGLYNIYYYLKMKFILIHLKNASNTKCNIIYYNKKNCFVRFLILRRKTEIYKNNLFYFAIIYIDNYGTTSTN